MNAYLSVPILFYCVNFVSQLKQVGVLEVGVSAKVGNALCNFEVFCTITTAKRGFNRVGGQLIWYSAAWLGQLDEFGIATGAECEELEAKCEDAPAIVESHNDVQIVGCSGGIGEDEHDVTWFHLEKGKTYKCPVCSQVFQLKVTGVGGQPGADEHH